MKRSHTSSVAATRTTTPAITPSSSARSRSRLRTRTARWSTIVAATPSSTGDVRHAGTRMTTLITPPRRRGIEYLDEPGLDPRLVRRSLADVALANSLFGGTRAVLIEVADVLPELGPTATLLDVGSGIGDIAARTRQFARTHDVDLSLVTIDMAETLAAASRARAGNNAVRGDATL